MGNALGDGRRALSKEVPVGYKRTEVGVIPEEWNAHPLRDDISLLSGHHVLARNYNIRGDGTPYITGPDDFSGGRIKQTKFTTKPTTICRAGDILVTVKGSGSGTLVEADTEYCISRQLMAIRTTAWNPTFLLYSLLQNASRIKAASTGLIPGLSRSDILDQTIPLPNDTAEQRAITEALSDVDKLLGALEKLIAKKRAIKQAAMQQLLTGKTRLPGFSGEWETKRLGNVAPLQRGFDLPTSQIRPGPYAVVYSNGVLHHHERAMAKGPGVVTGRSGTIGKVHFIEKDYWPHNTSLWVTSFCGNDPKFVYYFYTHLDLARFLSGSGVPTLNRNDVHQHLASCPSLPEQRAIATVLSDMDAETAALERRRDKTHAIKQGMMQQLLTGRVRLVKSTARRLSRRLAVPDCRCEFRGPT